MGFGKDLPEHDEIAPSECIDGFEYPPVLAHNVTRPFLQGLICNKREVVRGRHGQPLKRAVTGPDLAQRPPAFGMPLIIARIRQSARPVAVHNYECIIPQINGNIGIIQRF